MSFLSMREKQRRVSWVKYPVLRRIHGWCMLFIIGACLLCMGFFFSVLEEIDIVAIRDMHVRKEGDQHILDALVTIRNTSMKSLRLLKGDFELAVVTSGSEYIPLGKAHQEEISLEHQEGMAKSDTDILLSLPLGSEEDVYKLYTQLVATSQSILLELEPTIAIRLQANFKLAVQTAQAWNYSNGIQIDWIVTPEITRMELIEFLQAISGGEFIPPTPVPTPTVTPGIQE